MPGYGIVAADPDSSTAQRHKAIARKAMAKLALKAKDFSTQFPNIVIQNT
ncbi:MAG: hypothetical protein HOO93_02685 [Methyloglobulus sp.]|nr:hypothetical protein [Methyloglobulus sp.]